MAEDQIEDAGTRKELGVADGAEDGATIGAIYDLAGGKAVPIAADGRFGGGTDAGALMVPQGMRVVDLAAFLDRRLPAPRRTVGTTALEDLDSFERIVQRYAGDGARAVVFGHVERDRSAARLVAVLDHDKLDAPGWRAHRATYAFPVSDQWKAWVVDAPKAGAMPQGAFAEFLEDRLLDVLDPARFPAESSTRQVAEQLGLKLGTPNAILTLARGLTIHVGSKVRQEINLGTGEHRIEFDEAHEAPGGGPVSVPQAFAVAVPVFQGGPAYTVLVRLRYRVANGSVAWILTPHRPDVVFDDAYGEALAHVAETTKVPVLRGVAPEAAK